MKNTITRTKYLLMLPLMFLFAIQMNGQTKTVSGTVVDASDNAPLPGVSIQVKGTSNGTVTGFNGDYSLEVETGDVLTFSFIGYNTQEVTIGSQSTIDISLDVNVTELEEIVVIGYGTVDKKDATGSVTTVSSEDFNKGLVTSPQELLMGRTAGVQITTSGGAPGAGAEIRIRGGSSLSANNAPLIILDGVPLDNGGISGMSNPLSSINPNDIATFTVLKDASATAIYGSRASNGVIIITTKRGELGKPTVTYSGNVTFSTPRSKVENLNATEYKRKVWELIPETPIPEEAADDSILGDADTDWQSLIFRNTISTDHNVALTGSVANVPYRTSVGYTKQNGILLNSSMDRITASIGLDPTFLNDQIKMSVNARYANSEHSFSDQGAIGSAILFNPTQAPRTDSDDYGGYFYWAQDQAPGDTGPAPPIALSPANPLALLEQRNNIGNVNRFIGNAELKYSIPFVSGLEATVNIGTDRSWTDGLDSTSVEAAWTFDAGRGTGRTTVYDQEKINNILDAFLNYKTGLSGINSDLELTAGYSYQYFKSGGSSSTINSTNGFVYAQGEGAAENVLLSFFGRGTLNVADKYLFTATYRADGSSKFIGDNKFGFFPSTAFAWKVASEEFMKEQDLFSELKLRLGWGITGQQDVGNPYPALPVVTISQDQARYQLGNQYYNTIRLEEYDPNIKWEETTTFNAGIDFGILNDRITGSLDYYNRVSNDLLAFVPIPSGSNFSNFLLTNVGSLVNEGLEFNINGYAIDRGDFQLDLGLNFTINRNEIESISLVDSDEFNGILSGGISGGTGNQVQINSIGFPTQEFYLYEQVYDENGSPIEGLFVDQNEDGNINESDRVHYGNPRSPVFMGFSANLFYKNFNLGFNARANLGNSIYNNIESNYGASQNVYNAGGFSQNLTRSIYQTDFYNNQYLSSFYIQDGSFFRLDNITAGYRIDEFLDVTDLNIGFTVQNALVLTSYSGIDPEVNGGIDNTIYPRPTNFILSVRANF